ncbi:tryptophan 7-halogenase [Shewanella schlegeliana]|uniref:Tryptophan 7-halogenase n=1 Tax=Shewanella schlegeliana TaxID=190308 RepID=A0ABS1SUC7_9GAMM|nr:tryptophan halogenase family protein [Shewanella schlegeliana]MBL4912120.1 tryptophan 7-halogenase [Shewanella schlegeliana]MCL1110794.1 tryptophan 7-halogenase [Shewanella schlegeliana]GIU22962.1 tryptophan halogenase [Shewanella schlegeliana]
MEIKRVAIVGGGTAGWLAANHLGKAALDNQQLSVTLIESPDIPTIGVGEGTVPAIRQSLKSFGISETEFIRRCDVTFKQSIKFVNWLDKLSHGEANFYHHLFDMPAAMGEELTAQWLSQKDRAYAGTISPQHAVCEAYKAPKSITDAEYCAHLGYAYHLNAAKFAELLGDNAKERFRVEHIRANVQEVVLGEGGEIKSLVTDICGTLDFDFYIDCTGFASLLIDKSLKVPFVSKADELFVDKAIVVQVPTSGDEVIPPFTISTAHQAGWIWDIALSNRRGVGFVYCSKYMDDELALSKLDNYLGGNLSESQHRVIPMTVGYRARSWEKNCVALGLAQGFLEPLEATSILLTDFAAGLLASRFPHSTAQLPGLRQRFNHVMDYAWARVVDFIKLHYCLSDRTDSQFWIDNRDPATMSDELKKRLAMWQDFVPSREDFFSKFEVFDLENYLYVLYGMHYRTRVNDEINFQNNNCRNNKSYQQKLDEISAQLVADLPEHRELLEKIKRYGLQMV